MSWERVAAFLLFSLLLLTGLFVFYLPSSERQTEQATKNGSFVLLQNDSLSPPPSNKEQIIQEWLAEQKKFQELAERLQNQVAPSKQPTQDYLKKEEFIKSLNQTHLKELAQKLIYWNKNPKKNIGAKPINHERFLTWMPYSAGLNNRRISMEVAFVFALITNRTLVLPPLSGWQNPFPVPFLMEELHDEKDLRAGIPLLTWKEWLAYPEREKIWDDTVLCPWDLKYGNDVFVFPRAPHEQDPNFTAFSRYVAQHQEIIHIRDPFTIEGFTTAKNLFFPENMLFNHFYTQFYFTSQSPYQMKDITKLIRDYVHFPEEVLGFAARILYFLPPFSAMHYRRDDFAFSTGKLKPPDIFNETHTFYQDNETIYVSTDEKRETFMEEFFPIFSQRYRVVSLYNFSHLLYDMPPLYEPMVEMIVCSSARVFVGTMLSTYSGYIQRLRGYHKWVVDKGPHYTQKYTEGIPRWGQERPEAWDQIDDSR